MDEKLKAFIKKEIIDTNPIDLKDALVGGLSGVKIVKECNGTRHTETLELTLFIVVNGIPKSLDEIHKITVFAYNEKTGEAYDRDRINGEIYYNPITKVKGAYHPYWAFCYGKYEFDLDEMLEYREFIRRFDNDKLSFE